MLESATNELQTLGVEFFPNVTDWTEDAPNPYRDDLTSGPSVSDCTPGMKMSWKLKLVTKSTRQAVQMYKKYFIFLLFFELKL
jgi:hypothetical protein